MDLQKLRGFYWAIQRRSFSEAAQKMHVSQSAISHQVRALEQELGVKLYDRVGRGILPTPEGERLAHYARTILDSVDDLQSEFADLSRRPRGTIRIASLGGIATYELPRMVHQFRERNSDVRVTISSKVSDAEILDLVSRGEVDIGFAASWNDFKDLEFIELLSYDLYVCTPADHPWAGKRQSLALNEIAEQPLLLYTKETAIRRRIDQVFARHGLEPDVRIEIGTSQALLEYVRLGLGIAILSGLVVPSRLGEDLPAICVTELFGKLGYGIVLRPGRYFSQAIREFFLSAGVPEARLPL